MKAQVSVEYLSVYVWSAVALAVVVGVLAYVGVFSADTYSQEDCRSGSQIVCTDAVMYADGYFLVKVRNDMPKRVLLTGIELHKEQGITSNNGLNISLHPGEEGELLVITGEEYPDDSMNTFDFTATFTTDNALRYYNVSGVASTKVFNHIKYNVERVICGDETTQGDEQCDPPGRQDSCGTARICSSTCRCVPIEDHGPDFDQTPQS